MNASAWIRQLHRWLSIAFTLGFIVNLVAWQGEEPAAWVPLLALAPLILLLLSGLYLFALPYFGRRGRSQGRFGGFSPTADRRRYRPR